MSSQSGRATPSQGASISSADKIKIPIPDLYRGDRDKLEAYLVQVELYVKRHSSQFRFTEDKVLFASTYLRRNAFTWFHHFLTDYLQKEPGEREEETDTIFRDPKAFELRLRRVFGDIDKERTAERQLYNLRHKSLRSN